LDVLRDRGFEPRLSEESYREIIGTGFRGKNLPLAFVMAQLALEQQPITLRGLMYRAVSLGWLPSTDKEHYGRTKRLTKRLREGGVVPFEWIVDNVRNTEKPSSWAGLDDFADTVREAYRKNFWAEQRDYVHVICEKDAIAGVLLPTTREYDVSLSPIRGYVSLSFAHEVAQTWNRIDKPIYAFYLGDWDPSGFDLERDVHAKLRRYCERPFTWRRLGLNRDDFDDFDLIPLEAKKSDSRYRRFVSKHGTRCAELDALPATELRRRVEVAIQQHIAHDRWDRMCEVEALEKKTLMAFMKQWGNA
jgi:hypothetical protein